MCMVKITLFIEGMSCNMCEAHINDLIRKNFTVKKVNSSHRKGKTEIIAENEIDETSLRQTLASIGYTVLNIEEEVYEKKRFHLFS